MWAISSDVKLLNFPRIWSSVKWRGRGRGGWVILYRRVLLWGLKLYAGVSSIWLIVGHKNECVSSLCNQASYLFLKYNEKCKCHKPHNTRLYFCDNHILSLEADFFGARKEEGSNIYSWMLKGIMLRAEPDATTKGPPPLFGRQTARGDRSAMSCHLLVWGLLPRCLHGCSTSWGLHTFMLTS